MTCDLYDHAWPMVSIATMQQTVKKIMSKRKSDFLSFRFSLTTSADTGIAANDYLLAPLLFDRA